VKRFIHISIPNIEQDNSQYAKTKLEGERAIISAFPAATIMRPSVIFGVDDNFFNKFASWRASCRCCR
jgi:dTDP-4-dehydrorhamnose reductase